MILTEEQDDAIAMAVHDAPTLCCLTGGPGTGKTSTLRELLAAAGQAGLRVALAAPSGKAAQRMEEATGRSASTLHRLMGLIPGSMDWKPIDADILVIDESSMIDCELLACALEAARAGRVRTVLLVGDADQLPPVGAGQPFHDLLAGGVCPTVRLTKIHRQAQESGIVRAAHAIVGGDMPEFGWCPDFKLVECDDLEQIPPAIWEVITREGHDPNTSQVLAPQRNTAGGVDEINRFIEAARRPIEEDEPLVRGLFRVDTKVINTQNDYSLGVFNGELGEVVSAVDGGEKRGNDELMVKIAGEVKRYKGAAINALKPAWCLTVHKCVHPETLVSTAQGLLPISDLQPFGEIATAEGARDYQGKVHNPEARGLEIRTRRGFAVRVTPDHKLMARLQVQPGEFSLVEAGALGVGDELRLVRGPLFEDRDQVDLPLLPDGLGVRCVLPERMPVVVTADVAELFGLIVADGTVFKRGFRLVKRHPEVGARFMELVESVFGVKASPYVAAGSTGGEVNSTALAAWLQSVGGMSPRDKFIPECILRSSPRVQRAFLRGLFADGSAHIKPGGIFSHIEWSSAYPRMAEIVQVMLLDLGILASRRVLTRGSDTCSRLWIYGRDAGTFRDEIGFISNMKQGRLQGAGWGNDSIEPLVADAIESIDTLRMPSMCVEVPGLGRFVQNGFDGSNSQGSQWDHVIVVAHTSHTYMLTRRLLYVAITRAAKRVWVVGQSDAVAKAVRNTRDAKRFTWLARRFKRDQEAREVVA